MKEKRRSSPKKDALSEPKSKIEVPDHFEWIKAVGKWQMEMSRSISTRYRIGVGTAFEATLSFLPQPPVIQSWLVDEPELTPDEIQEAKVKRWASLGNQEPSDKLAEAYRSEWDFSEIIEKWKKAKGTRKEAEAKELHNCLVYELARESATPRTFAARSAESRLKAIAAGKKAKAASGERGSLLEELRKHSSVEARQSADEIEAELQETPEYREKRETHREWNIAFHFLSNAFRQPEPCEKLL